MEDRVIALNIKNPVTGKLAREVAAEAGETLTDAIQHSLEERLERLKGRRSAADLLTTLRGIGQRCSLLPDRDRRSADDILGYDEHGAFR